MSTLTTTRSFPTMLQSLMKAFRRIDAAWRWCLGAWLSVRIFLSAWGVLLWAIGWITPQAGKEFWWGVAPVLDGWRGALLGVWLRWDGIYYLRIATEGYAEARLSAFLPLYPILSGVISGGFRLDVLFAMLLVSNVCLILALVQFYRLAESLYSTEVARRAVVVMLLYPMAFFFFAPYPQSLALLLALLAYTAARQGQWLMAALAGLLGGLSHGSVIPLCAALAWEAWEQRHDGPSPKNGRFAAALPWLGRAAAAASPLIGLAIFLAWRQFAGLPGFGAVQVDYWGRVAMWPWQTLAHLWRSLAAGQFSTITYIDFAAALTTLVLTAWSFKRLPAGLRIYQAAMILTLLSTTVLNSPLGSWGRMSLMMFPLFLGLALWTENRGRALVAFGVGTFLQLFLVTNYFMWGFVG